MKTIETEIYLQENWENRGYPKFCTGFDNSAGCTIKAKLIIEVPERKAEITESQLRDCFDSFRRLENDHDRTLVYSFYEFAKQKLFGDGEK